MEFHFIIPTEEGNIYWTFPGCQILWGASVRGVYKHLHLGLSEFYHTRLFKRAYISNKQSCHSVWWYVSDEKYMKNLFLIITGNHLKQFNMVPGYGVLVTFLIAMTKHHDSEIL